MLSLDPFLRGMQRPNTSTYGTKKTGTGCGDLQGRRARLHKRGASPGSPPTESAIRSTRRCIGEISGPSRSSRQPQAWEAFPTQREGEDAGVGRLRWSIGNSAKRPHPVQVSKLTPSGRHRATRSPLSLCWSGNIHVFIRNLPNGRTVPESTILSREWCRDHQERSRYHLHRAGSLLGVLPKTARDGVAIIF